MKSSELEIPTHSGRNLHAHLDMPATQKATRFAIFAHCLTCSGDMGAIKTISRALTDHGIGVVRFDFNNLGRSNGQLVETTFSANVEDLRGICSYMENELQAPALLIGHSLGGAAVLVAAEDLPGIKAVAIISAPADLEHAKNMFQQRLDQIKTEINADGGETMMSGEKFIESLKEKDLEEIVHTLRKPLLILHSPQDKRVDIGHAARLYKAAFHPKSFISLDGADHLITNKKDAVYIAEVIASWVSRYFEIEDKLPLSTKGEQVVAHLDLADKYTTQIHTTRHSLTGDEPESHGGDDFGPSPYELLNSALGACTAMTLKMYANRKGWPLKEVFVYLTYAKKHAEELGMGEEKMSYIDVIDKKLEIVGDLTDEQKERLREIAAKCPVHRTLLNEVVIRTELMPSD